MRFTLLIFLSLFMNNSFAFGSKGCDLKAYRTLKHSISLDKGISFAFQDEGEIKDKTPGLLINRCKEDGLRRRYLMLGHGPIEYGTRISNLTSSFTDTTAKMSCSIKGADDFADFSQDVRQAFFSQRRDFINKCVYGTIKDFGSRKLSFRNQELCKITRKGNNSAFFEGQICYFKIAPDSEFVVTYRIKDECTDAKTLASFGIEPQEINTLVTVATTKKMVSEGRSFDSELIGTKIVNFLIDAPSENLNLSDDWGLNVPQYPSRYDLPNVELSNLMISDFGNTSNVTMEWVASNICKQKVCKDGVCTSSCNYSKPLFGEVELFEVIKGKKEFLSSWTEGHIVPAKWQGVLSAQPKFFTDLQFKKGSKYVIEVKFYDPKFDYTQFNKSIGSQFKPILGIPNTNFGINLAQGIPVMHGVNNFSFIENLNMVNSYMSGRALGTLIDGEGINTMSKFSYWPPLYTEGCDLSGKKCREFSNKPYLTLGMSFTPEENLENPTDLKITNVKTYRNSAIIKNIQFKKHTPSLECK